MVTIVKGESCVSISIYEDKDRTLYIMYVLLTVASDHTLTSIVYFRFRRVGWASRKIISFKIPRSFFSPPLISEENI